MGKNDKNNIIGITMGDPVGIGAEIIVKAVQSKKLKDYKLIVLGDSNLLQSFANKKIQINSIDNLSNASFNKNILNVLNLSNLKKIQYGKPNIKTSKAMISYIEKGIELVLKKEISAIVTCPINKLAMKKAGSKFTGHTEFLADRTKTKKFVMMLAGDKLKVVLVTIHISLKDVPKALTKEKILETIIITNNALKNNFKIKNPKIAVAGLNPHSGEGGLFGDEEEKIINPAIMLAKKKGITVFGAFPPDTIYFQASQGKYDVVISMYHDQGLIPLKLLHFDDGVNVTLGLPIIRTSVDHGTAYDIAGQNKANPESLISAIKMACDMIN